MSKRTPEFPALVYKIVPKPAWEDACLARAFTGSADDVRDGFIHLSTGPQVASTAAKHFAGQDGLVLVALATARLGDALKWEPSRGGALFPHLYGPLEPASALWVREMPLGSDGIPRAPEEISQC